MASSCDSAKMQLSAIFKLEFYKNKKDWKLSKDGKQSKKKHPLSPKISNKLEKTYSVRKEYPNPEFDREQVPSDNKVSLHEEPAITDNILEPQLPDFNTLGPEAPKRSEPEASDPSGPGASNLPGPEASDLPGPEASDLPGPEAPDHNLYQLHSWSGQLISGDRAEGLWQDTQLPARQPYWQDRCGMETSGILEEVACDQCDGPNQHYLTAPDARAHDWWLQEDYSLFQEEFKFLYDEEQGLSKFEVQAFDTPTPATTAAMSCSIEVPSQVMSELVDDTADFMRGAHLALHSSEIDLNTTQECSCTGKDNLWVLSVKQLARAIQRHELALALLLEERARRDQLSVRSVPYPRLPFDDWMVTCDTNRLRPPDGILPGGHWAPSGPDGIGRGRGRLQQARKQYDTIR